METDSTASGYVKAGFPELSPEYEDSMVDNCLEAETLTDLWFLGPLTPRGHQEKTQLTAAARPEAQVMSP